MPYANGLHTAGRFFFRKNSVTLLISYDFYGKIYTVKIYASPPRDRKDGHIMALVTTKEMFKKAYEGGYAIGAFNINNMEIIQAITEAAGEVKSPVIL